MKTPFVLLMAATLAAAPRPMTFMDVMHMRTVAGGTLSNDANWFAYTISNLDWKAGKRFTDVWLTATATGVSRQFTFTSSKNETAPAFSPDGQTLAFLSDREGASNQLFLMPVGGGEARRVSDVPGGVASFAYSKDGNRIALLGGRGEEKQIYLYEASSQEDAKVRKRHTAGVIAMHWSPDSKTLFFTAPDSLSPAEKRRMDLKFDVRIVDQPKPPTHVWALDAVEGVERRLTGGADFTVRDFGVSPNGEWIVLQSGPVDRHDTDIATRKREAWLVNASSGKRQRLTNNTVSESLPKVSPDGKWVAMTAPDKFQYFNRSRIFLRLTEGPGEWKSILSDKWDHDPERIAWAVDSRRLYFETGIGASDHAFTVPVEGGQPAPLTTGDRVVNPTYHPASGKFFLTSSDSEHPADYFLAAPEALASPARWTRLSDANPQVKDFQLGKTETVRWKSTDGSQVEGILVYPLDYQTGRRVPLLVQIHGGPASATTMGFAASHSRYDHLYAAAGYAVLHPNYRGSTNYGEKFKTAIVGNYFPQAFDDIMTGVDELIRRGLADPDKLGLFGWSAGGHWSNWALTHTNRFKAISSGAGAMNWVSMYAQNDSQANREHYFAGTPYDNFDHWMEMSPIKYIKNAKTPTLIHVGHDDLRVPRPQSEELHMALKKLGIPTEFIVYPRMGHGLTEPRYQMVKMVSEFRWFEKWIKGKEKWLDWQELVDTVGN
ncbi:MAG: S9 family peptidase [Acidobacteria bacterium]|nr:S9 family peptidase [Acidobacteriota bacterium]